MWHLIATVYKQVADPLAFAREALDLSMGRGLDADGARRVRDEIAERFALHRSRAAPAFDYLIADDFEPLAHPSADVVVGTPPTLHAVRDAQVMQRQRALQALRKALDAVVTERHRPAYRLLDAVRRPGIAMAYTQDLVDAFARALRTDPPTALRLMRVLASGHERLEIIDQPTLAKRCAETWPAADASSDALPEFMRTELRVQWAVWAATEPAVADALQLDALDDARTALSQGHAQWVRLWHLLAAAYPNQPQALELGSTWATDPAHFDTRYWSILWESLLDADWSGAGDSNAQLDALIALGRRWLRSAAHRPQPPRTDAT